jgi:hypothetical protein
MLSGSKPGTSLTQARWKNDASALWCSWRWSHLLSGKTSNGGKLSASLAKLPMLILMSN